MNLADVAPIGADWQLTSSIWGRRCGSGESFDQLSPLDSSRVQRARLIDPAEMSELLRPQPPLGTVDGDSLRSFCSRLHQQLHAVYPAILEATQWETAFVPRDCEEVVLSCLGYVKGFPEQFASLPDARPTPLGYRLGSGQRSIDQISVPWGTIAVILPQSAFLSLALTCLLNALASGNRVILRAPMQSARSAALLSLAIERANPPDDFSSVVLVSARTFLAALCDSPQPLLVHYLGSSAHAPQILSACFEAGKQALIDGEGNGWVWVDEDTPLAYASDILTSGALRYNGQTCSSINGAVIHPRLYERLREGLAARWRELRFGSPLEAGTQVGPLLEDAQAQQCVTRISQSGASLLAGGDRRGNLFAPTLAAQPRDDSELVSEGLFGAAMWIAPGDIDTFAALWRRNRYPLCACVLTRSDAAAQRLSRLPGLARLTVNGDPSIEYLYEPWGGYPSSGTNPVGHWHCKYLRAVQVDRPA